ncbi:hypothetical protein EMGBS8_19340 [Verrucomicrobiota bacterium]|nr:hypothetical protein EMGBS8_19340 [Verrucomicrobiota bacterium]
MNALSISCLLLVSSTLMLAQALPKNREEIDEANRFSELNADRITGSANGQPITLSDLRRQVEPFVAEIRRGKSDAELIGSSRNTPTVCSFRSPTANWPSLSFKTSTSKNP